MKLLTKEILRNLPPLGSQDGLGDNAIAVVKFFNPTGCGTWYASEFDNDDTFFGLVDLIATEFGYFSLLELQNTPLPYGLRIECDLHFRPTPFCELPEFKKLGLQ